MNKSLFNFVWWLGQAAFWALIIILTIDLGDKPLPPWFWLVFVAGLFVQGLLHWLILNRRYRPERKGNIIMVATMPVLIFLGLWIDVLLLSLISTLLHGY